MKRFLQKYEKQRIKFWSILLILTACANICLSTQTKYVSYVNAYTAAAATDFYFGSNYLGSAEDGRSYSLSSWSGRSYNISIDIRNYENSLLFNEDGVDFYYQVEGTVYKDKEFTEVYDTFTVVTEYSSGEGETVVIGDETYGYLKGMSSFEKATGSQSVSLTATSTNLISDTVYLQIVATTYPLIEEEITDSEDETEEIVKTTKGVFESEIEAVFILSNTTGSTSVTTILATSDASSEVQLRITCPEIEGASTQKLGIYYDHTLLNADTSVMSNVAKIDGTNYTYGEITVGSNSLTTLNFWKTSMTTIEMGTSSDYMEQIYVEEIY